MKKVLFVNATLGLGGVERSLVDLVNRMNENKYDIYLYCDSTEGGLASQLDKKVQIIEPNLNGSYGRFYNVCQYMLSTHQYGKLAYRFTRALTNKLGMKSLFLLKPFFKRYGKFDCIIAYREGFYTRFADTVFPHKRLIGWWHCGACPQSDVLYENDSHVDALITVSKSNQEMLKDTLPTKADMICAIPNMVDSLHIEELSKRFSPFLRNNEIIYISTVSRLSPEKHLENIIICAKSLEENNVKFEWRIIGTGLEREKLQDMIDSYGLSESVILTGGQDNPYPYLRLSDLYVHTSYVESQGLAVLEAMALGVPCVVTKSLGPCEFIEDGVNGLLTEQSPESLTEKVLTILNDKELYQHIKENTKCPEQFRPDQVMKQIEAQIDE